MNNACQWKQRLVLLLLSVMMVAGCYRPPYNQFEPYFPSFFYTRAHLIKQMKDNDIQLVEYGDTLTLIVPTDRYYQFHRAHLHDLQYPGLEAMLDFIRLYPGATIVVVGFSDNMGSRRVNTELASARAHTMVTFLYANGIPSKQVFAQAFGPLFPIGDQQWVHGAAYNRRIEIQWHRGGNHKQCARCPAVVGSAAQWKP